MLGLIFKVNIIDIFDVGVGVGIQVDGVRKDRRYSKLFILLQDINKYNKFV